MINDVIQLRSINFLPLKLPQIGYADQTQIFDKRVSLATACAVHYGLHTGMVI
jgi:hypothetical protein